MLILDNNQIRYKLTRIAYQIFEEHINEKSVNIIGIKKGGFILAKEISNILSESFDFKVKINFIEIDKKTYHIKDSDFSLNEIENKNIILIDDVLKTGKTMIYTISHLLKVNLNSLKIAVLIDRSYKKFPIKCNYQGISLFTSLLDSIDVTFEENEEINAYLN